MRTDTDQPDPRRIVTAIEKRSFATLATTSRTGRAHVAGVLYAVVDEALYVNTLRTSRKARNIDENPHVAMCIPIRRLPVGPPSSVQFQTTARLVDLDAPEIVALVADGRLSAITGHGELTLSDGCFVRVALPRRILTYGLGMSLRKLIADPLGAGGAVERTDQVRESMAT